MIAILRVRVLKEYQDGQIVWDFYSGGPAELGWPIDQAILRSWMAGARLDRVWTPFVRDSSRNASRSRTPPSTWSTPQSNTLHYRNCIVWSQFPLWLYRWPIIHSWAWWRTQSCTTTATVQAPLWGCREASVVGETRNAGDFKTKVYSLSMCRMMIRCAIVGDVDAMIMMLWRERERS